MGALARLRLDWDHVLLFLVFLLPLAPPVGGSGGVLEGGKCFVFYYLWYGDVGSDGAWQHWDHEVLPHWTPSVNARFPSVGTRHAPPEVLHSPYYPARGPYSSTNLTTLREHMREIRSIGDGTGDDNGVVVVVSWWGRASLEGTADTQGVQTDYRVALLLEAAEAESVPVAWHMEPYPGRTASSFKEDVAYIERKYGASRAVYREGGRAVYFVYDSYHIPPQDWAQVLPGMRGKKGADGTIGTGIFIGLWLERNHLSDLHQGSFDGFYTYFASDGFVYGSTTRHWRRMVEQATSLGMASVLSAGPGYNDEGIRPWNSHNTKSRRGGEYYQDMLRSALGAGPTAISVTSYNEWGEGTQIEPAVPHSLPLPAGPGPGRSRGAQPGDSKLKVYHDYGAGGPGMYISLTREWFQRFRAKGGGVTVASSPAGPGERSTMSGLGDSEVHSGCDSAVGEEL